MSDKHQDTSLSSVDVAPEGRRETPDEDSSTQNNELADLTPNNRTETGPSVQAIDDSDIFLGAGICQTSVLTSGTPSLPNHTRTWINGTTSMVGVAPMNSLIDLESENAFPLAYEEEIVNADRSRIVNSGMVPIAENFAQVNGMYNHLIPEGGSIESSSLDRRSSGGAVRSERIPLDLPLLSNGSGMLPGGSFVSDFPQTPFLKRENGFSALYSGYGFQPVHCTATSSTMGISLPGDGNSNLQATAPPLSRAASTSSTQAVWRNRMRREQIMHLSQNPLGPHAVIANHSQAQDMASWNHRNTSHQDGMIHTSLVPAQNLYSKYHNRPGVITRFRRRVFSLGGKFCRNFFVWVLMVATLAGIEGFKEKSQTLRHQRNVASEIDWSDSDTDTEQEQGTRIRAFSFKG